MLKKRKQIVSTCHTSQEFSRFVLGPLFLFFSSNRLPWFPLVCLSSPVPLLPVSAFPRSSENPSIISLDCQFAAFPGSQNNA